MKFGNLSLALVSFASVVSAAPAKPDQHLKKRYIVDGYTCNSRQEEVVRKIVGLTADYAGIAASFAVTQPRMVQQHYGYASLN